MNENRANAYSAGSFDSRFPHRDSQSRGVCRRGRGNYRGKQFQNVKQTASEHNNPNQSTEQHTSVSSDTSRVDERRRETYSTVYELLYDLEHLWKLHKQKQATQLIRKHIHDASNPYEDVIKMLESCSDLSEQKTMSLAFSIAKELCNYIKLQAGKLGHLLTEELQLKAFELATSNEKTIFIQFFEILAETFDLRARSYLGIPFCNKLLGSGKEKDAAMIINCLRLHNDYDLTKQLVIPLLLQDKINVIEVLVRDSSEEQKKLVLFFDKISDKNFDLSALLPDGPVTVNLRLNRKVIKKHGLRLMKHFNIPLESCPNLANEQSMSFVRHLTYRYFQEKNLPYNNWLELTRSALANNHKLVSEFVNFLAGFDLAEAHKWFVDYNLPPNGIDADVVSYLPPEENPMTEENWDTEDTSAVKYYHLKLSASNIIMVDSTECYTDAVAKISKAENGWIGIDGEWKPIFSSSGVTRMSILQIATLSHVYIFDIIHLQSISDMDWSLIINSVFLNPNLLKIGYGFTTDLKMLHKAIPGWETKALQPMIDLCKVQADVCQARGITPSAESDKGLSEAVRLFLGGRTLDKGEQMSDWERRPLRFSQLVYAALDAFCLLELWKVLEPATEELNIFVNTAGHHSSTAAKSTHVKKKVAKSKKQKPEGSKVFGNNSNMPSENSTSSIKFVVSNMLQGLGKQLRLLGVDVHIIADDNGDDHDDAATISRKENRVILTSGKPYNRLLQLSSPGMCFAIDTELPARLQAIAVLKYFNIKVTKENLFSRCQICNNGRYIIIDCPDMRRMRGRYVERQPPLPEDWCKLSPSSGYDEAAIALDNGIHLQLEPVTEKILSNVDIFFCCSLCGKVFWEGSHYDRVFKNFEHILTIQDGNALQDDAVVLA